MPSAAALALFDVQVRQSTRPDYPGIIVESDGTIVRQVSPTDRGSSWITWSRLTEHNADAVIAGQVAYFRARHQQVEWKLYDYDQPPDLAIRLMAAGFLADDEEVLMVAEAARVVADRAGAAPPPGMSVREVTGAAGVEQIFAVHRRAFGTDQRELRRSLLERLAAAPDSFAMMIAFAGTEPVSAARIEFPAGADFAGLWGGGTVPAWRGRGLYRALVAGRAQIAVARGYRYLQVDALPTSQPILTRLGFTSLARTTPYVWDPGVAPGTLRLGLPARGRRPRYHREAGCGRAEIGGRDRRDASSGQGRRRRADRRAGRGGHRRPA
jgi:GNAT superfamily N-acetyltransferase